MNIQVIQLIQLKNHLILVIQLNGCVGQPSDSSESSEYSSDSIDLIEKSLDSSDSIEWVGGGSRVI